MKVNLNSFKRDSEFYGELELLVTIKSFDVAAIRKRYIESRKNKSKRSGAVERRKTAKGGIAQIDISKGKLKELCLLKDMEEPRGLAQNSRFSAFALEKEVLLFENEGRLKTIRNPWFSYIHSLDFNENTLLIASSGFDAIFEYDVNSLEKINEWFAWENGINKARNPETGAPLYLSKSIEQATLWRDEGKDVLLIANPEFDSLPTAKRAAFINSVSYRTGSSKKVIATLFHEGKLIEIDLENRKFTVILEGLKNPHGGFCRDQLMATSTGSGEVYINDTIYSFKELPNKASMLGGMEWIQNSIPIGNNTFISIDSNRSSFIIFNTESLLLDMLAFDENWAVQDLIINKAKFNLERFNEEV